jgi:hypothetical protein
MLASCGVVVEYLDTVPVGNIEVRLFCTGVLPSEIDFFCFDWYCKVTLEFQVKREVCSIKGNNLFPGCC